MHSYSSDWLPVFLELHPLHHNTCNLLVTERINSMCLDRNMLKSFLLLNMAINTEAAQFLDVCPDTVISPVQESILITESTKADKIKDI